MSYAPAVDPNTRKLNSTSVSAITKFDPAQDGGCPQRWYRVYVKGEKEPRKKAQDDGVKVHAQLEHYFKTGENVLGSIALAGKHLLPEPGPDLYVEWGLNNAAKQKNAEGRDVFFPASESLLRAADVPLIGWIDLINPRPRGDPDGTVEAADHKTTSSVEKWAKADHELVQTPQMAGYATFLIEKYPDLTHARISHNVFQTDGKAARRPSALLTIAEIKSAWYQHGHEPVERMKEAATRETVEEVPANLSACGDFGGCPFRNNCKAFRDQKPIERMKMSLLSKLRGNKMQIVDVPPAQTNGASAAQTAAPAPVQPPPPKPVSSVPPPPVLSSAWKPQGATAQASATCGACGAALTSENSSQRGGTWKHIGCAATAPQLPVSAPVSAPPAPPVQALNGTPPPPPMAKRGPGRPRKTAEAPAANAATAAAPAPIQAPATPAPIDERTINANAMTNPPPTKAAAKTKAEAKALAATGIRLFINCIPSEAYSSLDVYTRTLTKSLEEKFDVSDVRAAPDANHQLAYSRWKGILAALVRNELPVAGDYSVFTEGNEIAQVVAEALTPVADFVARGVR